jgi:hypothetical protein
MTDIEADEIVFPEGRDRTWTRRAIELLQINAVAAPVVTRSGACGRKKE